MNLRVFIVLVLSGVRGHFRKNSKVSNTYGTVRIATAIIINTYMHDDNQHRNIRKETKKVKKSTSRDVFTQCGLRIMNIDKLGA